jgi:glycosyltransferase involved in cell wall biosynthesis
MNTNNQNILLSVLIPSYNHAKYIEETIQSIWKQNNANTEIIVIDDGSTDNSLEILTNIQRQSPIPMYVETQKNMGIVKTLNKALSKAQGKYIALIASDDMYFENAFHPLLEILEQNANIKIAYGNGHGFSEKGIDPNKIHNKKIADLLNQSSQNVLNSLLSSVPRPLLLQCCIIDTKTLRDIDGWDDTIKLDDWPMHIRIFQHLIAHGFQHKFIDHNVALYRDHATQTNKNDKKMFAMIEEVIERYSPESIKNNFFAFEAINHAKTLLKNKYIKEGNNLLFRALKADLNITNILKVIRIFLKYNTIAFFKR